MGSGNPGLNRIIPPPPNPHLCGREGTAGGGACARACAGAVRSQRVGRLGLAAWLRQRAPAGTHLDLPKREDAFPSSRDGQTPRVVRCCLLHICLNDKGAKVKSIEHSSHFQY